MEQQSQTPILKGAWTALLLLFFVSVLNYLDRFVLSVLLPAIKEDLSLSDTALGAVSTAFTISYVLLGIPFARFADRHSRKAIVSVSLAIWSVMTAASGLAQNFMQLAIARVFVGVGEAGATPPAHSIISDYFPPRMRAKALSIYGLGAPVGLILSFSVAVWLVETYDWRIAFYALGIPGVLFAVLCYFLIKEPPRGFADANANRKSEAEEAPSLSETMAALLRSPAFLHFSFGTAFYTVVYISVVTWLPSYFIRSFELELTQVGFWLAISVGVSQLIGVLSSGVVTDILTRNNVMWFSRIPALAMFISSPLLALVFWTENAVLAAVLLAPAFMISMTQGPPSFAAIQAIAHVRMRAMAVALFILITNLLGGLIGPLFTGWLSDQFVSNFGADSLKWSLMIVSITFGLCAGIHYWLAGRTVKREILARSN